MNKKFFLVGLSLSIFLVSFFSPKKERKHFEKEESSPRGDWFYDQRTFPYSEINYAEYGKAIERSASMKAVAKHTNAAWEFAGPINIGGRITDVEMPSSNTSIIYAGSASGGIFKSTDFGNSWNAIFDDAKSLSIGDITLAPSNENVLYVGTGEPNGGSGSLTYGGFGVYKSTNAGESWTHCGLDSTRFIGKIAVHPTNYNIAYVAAMGTMYSKNEQRGVYRTFDGGLSWQKVFFLSDSTGCIDIAINPNAPNIIYAAMFERMRYAWQRSYGGITSGLYRSTDAGNTWTQLTNGLPPNSPNISRITIALFHPNPEIIYVSYAASSGELMGVYKTTNGGETWTPINSAELSGIFTSYGYWFGGIKVHSSDSNILYMLGLYSMKSTNGGANWFSNDFNVHVDHHALFVHPQNPSLVLEGNDGGLYYSNDGGNNFTHFENLPNNQFYTCEVDEQNPTNLYGGTQDNGTNRTLTGNLNDWQELFGGDGFYVLVDPNDNSFLYMEYQYGGFSFGTNGINFSDRFNWSTPFVFNPLNSASLFLGSDKMYKTTDRANNWTAISPDLTNGPSPGNLPYGTITTIAVAPSDSNTIYAGTDDANVWVTTNSGVNWTNISDSLPNRWITRVAVDNVNPLTAYVTISGYRWGENIGHIYRTTNAGADWNNIHGNLPDAPINDIIVDTERDSTLYIATDVGVYATENLGNSWHILGNNLPNVVVNDLRLHNPTRTLVAATYGRSMYKIKLDSVSSVQSEVFQKLRFSLEQNFPNPFNSTTKIRFTIPESGYATLQIFDISGKVITILVSRQLSAGNHEIDWSANEISSGVYLFRLTTDTYIETKKLMVIK